MNILKRDKDGIVTYNGSELYDRKFSHRVGDKIDWEWTRFSNYQKKTTKDLQVIDEYNWTPKLFVNGEFIEIC